MLTNSSFDESKPCSSKSPQTTGLRYKVAKVAPNGDRTSVQDVRAAGVFGDAPYSDADSDYLKTQLLDYLKTQSLDYLNTQLLDYLKTQFSNYRRHLPPYSPPTCRSGSQQIEGVRTMHELERVKKLVMAH